MNTRIRDLRKSLGLTQREFAGRLGLDQRMISNYERNRMSPSRAVIYSICREFNVNEEWLKTGQGEMRPKKAEDEALNVLLHQYLNEKDRDDPLKENFIRMLLLLNEEEWKMVAFTIQKLAGVSSISEMRMEQSFDEPLPETWSQRQARLLRQEADAIERGEGKWSVSPSSGSEKKEA